MVEKLLLVRVRPGGIEPAVLGGHEPRPGERFRVGVELCMDGLDGETGCSAVEVILAADKLPAGRVRPVEMAHGVDAELDGQACAAAQLLEVAPSKHASDARSRVKRDCNEEFPTLARPGRSNNVRCARRRAIRASHSGCRFDMACSDNVHRSAEARTHSKIPTGPAPKMRRHIQSSTCDVTNEGHVRSNTGSASCVIILGKRQAPSTVKIQNVNSPFVPDLRTGRQPRVRVLRVVAIE